MTTVEDVEICKKCNNISYHVVFDTMTCLYTGFCFACGYSEDEVMRKGKVRVETSGGRGVIEISAKQDTGVRRLEALNCRTRRGAENNIRRIESDPNLTIIRATFFGEQGLEFLRGEADLGWAVDESGFDPALPLKEQTS